MATDDKGGKMETEIMVPMLPDSITEATVVNWSRAVGESIGRDELLVEIETDKVVLEVPAPIDGVVTAIDEEAGVTVVGGQRLGAMAQGDAPESSHESSYETAHETAEPPDTTPHASPSIRKQMVEKGVTPSEVEASGKKGRVLRGDVDAAANAADSGSPPQQPADSKQQSKVTENNRTERREPMSRLRVTIADRLLMAKQSTAMLTTFNEVNMQAVIDLRTTHREAFEKVHGVRLGFMSIFVQAAAIALQRHPQINAAIDGGEMVYHNYCDIGIAVSSERGLVVPVLRNCEQMAIADIEASILSYAEKARAGKLTLDELSGGTFTITNGGVFGSMLSTPILNPPQSAILGMHAIQKRAVVIEDEIVVRPMMYLALSYDHRVVDGKQAVTFLKTIKELVEDPARVLLDI